MAAAPYIPPSFGQPGVSISYRPKPLLRCSSSRCSCSSTSSSNNDAAFPIITVAVPPASIHHIFAHRQWRAGMLMSDALLSSAFAIANRTILELGAGTGLPSITAALIGTAKLVVASDYDEPQLVSQLRANVTRNLASGAVSQVQRTKCKVVGHIWGKHTEELEDHLPQGVHKFDSVLLADCLWDPLSHADLLKTVLNVLATDPAARVNVIAGLHTGREKVTSFIRRAYRAGLRLAEIERPELWPQLPQDTAATEDPDATRAGNEALALANERILEIEVCGNTPVQLSSASTESNSDGDGDDEPRLTGSRRPFLIEGYGEQAEGDVKLRNRWLTVWSLEWASL